MAGYETRPARREWIRGRADHRDGWIIIDKPESYMIQGEKDLAFDLAAVHDHNDALGFAGRHGLLRTGPGSEEYRELFADWERTAFKLRRVMEMYVTLGRAEQGDADAMMKLRSFENWFVTRGYIDASVDESALLGKATQFLADTVREELVGVQQSLVATESVKLGRPRGFAFTADSPTLVGYAYHDFARRIVNSVPMRTCVECGRAFVLEDKRQKYCSDKCSNRYRHRQWLKNQAAKEGGKDTN